MYSFDGTIHEFNKSCYTLLGYTKEEYAKLKLNDILTGSIIENVDNHAAILAGESKTVYRNLMCKNGDLIEAEVTIKLLADGKAIAFARDLTERKYTAEKFAAMEKEIMDGKIEEQKKITRAVINAQEKERKHIERNCTIILISY
ncbi:MAG: PAS domain S-box protein [Ferruginibacter sp.]